MADIDEIIGHLTPQRSNGFRSMVDRIRAEARAAAATAAV